MAVVGEPSIDYSIIKCAECGTMTQNVYLGGDPAVPHFEATCKQCNETYRVKFNPMQWKGLPLHLEDET